EADITSAVNALVTLEAKRTTDLAAARTRKAELEQELPPSLVVLTEQVEHARQFREALGEHRQRLALQTSLRARLEVRQRWQRFLNKAATSFAEAEADLSRRTVAAIDGDYKSTFQRLVG